ncbi:hypothetical protein SDRG_00312 [Saprolegnia diclina VS20]|uniref:Uncharacterized protein n=1 Tax=Saprolegnia diclina (strain VS20) TaxID=1156394 RepID=T0SB30_SAPDV|nr:hypothetical protein SDRG_00312 [Saprolegnia diclina VS20]EQC42583.1 hypothetical protein SDRG_00312 [Saprolegnia diclina VS20]|eukprot:XP_008604006.1 hypothetical protein SDRG_00312 [Saprolegnia diclina VS20]
MGRRARRKAMASLSDSDRDDEMEKGHGSEKHAATVEDHAKRLQDHDYRRELHAAAAAVHEDAVAQSRHARHAERRKVRHEKAMERELAHLDEEKESYEAKMLKIYKKHSARREKLDAKREHKEANSVSRWTSTANATARRLLR